MRRPLSQSFFSTTPCGRLCAVTFVNLMFVLVVASGVALAQTPPSQPTKENIYVNDKLVVIEELTSSSSSANNSAFISQSVPTTMTAGQNYTASVTMRNNGTTTWTPGLFDFGSQNPQNNKIWGLQRVSLPTNVAPNTNMTFTFTITAPSTAGTYNFQWRMIEGASTWFGALTTNVAVTVGGTAVGYDVRSATVSVQRHLSSGEPVISPILSILFGNTRLATLTNIVSVTKGPHITGISPSSIRINTNATVTITGSNLGGATALRLINTNGLSDSTITVSNIAVNGGGTSLTATIAVGSSTTTGRRVVFVVTPGGRSLTEDVGPNAVNITP